MKLLLQISFVSLILCLRASCTQLTFELHERKKDCFYETFESGEKAQIDFRVLSGGNTDINVRLFEPDGEPMFSADKETKGGLVFTVAKSGIYRACFSNEFSALTRKLVYFALRSGRSDSTASLPASSSAGDKSFGQEEEDSKSVLYSIESIGSSLQSISEYQRHMRLSETVDRLAAEATLNRVGAWSLVEILAVLLAAGIQVLAVRRLFPAARRSEAAVGLGKRA